MPRERSSDGRDFLFVQSTTELGGAEKVLLNLIEGNQDLRDRSVIVTLGFGDGDLPDRLRQAGASVVELKMGRLSQPWKLPPILQAIRRVAREAGVKVVIGNGTHPQVVAGVAARLAGARAAFMIHAIYPYPLQRNGLVEALALIGPCDMAIAVSDAARQAIAALKPRTPTRLVHNGTPLLEVSAADAQQARRELGATEGDVLIGCFGRLQRWKGQDVFVDAAGQIARQDARARFVVVGGATFGMEPEYFEGLKRTARDLGLGDRLVFTGFRSDVPRLMAACDVVCHTSRVPEPFGLVVVEAMALGRPMIATRGGGPSEIIADESHGILVAPGDPAALGQALSGLLADPDRRRRIGAAGQARIRAEFSIQASAGKLVRCLDELAARA